MKNLIDGAKKYTVVMVQVLNGCKYVMGCRAMEASELECLLASGATVLHRGLKCDRLITVLMN